MNGISSKALSFGGNENKYRFNGYEQQNKEFIDGSGLEWYDYKKRFYDNQIGRFFVQDGLANEYVYYTPYQFAGNEVPNAIDLDGLEPFRSAPGAGKYAYDKLVQFSNWVNDFNPIAKAAEIITGKSVASDFTQDKSRVESTKELVGTLVTLANPEGKAATMLGSAIEKGFLKAEVTLGRKGALNEIKRDLEIPKSQHPDKLTNNKQFENVQMVDRNGKTILGADGKPVITREYTYTRPDGSKVKVQDHSAGHPQFGKDNPGKHFNVRPSDNTRTGSVPDTKKHYPFN